MGTYEKEKGNIVLFKSMILTLDNLMLRRWEKEIQLVKSVS